MPRDASDDTGRKAPDSPDSWGFRAILLVVPSVQLRASVLTAVAGTLVLALAAVGAAESGRGHRRTVVAARPVVARATVPVVASPAPTLPPPGGGKCVGLVALTFDDGPQPGVTEKLVRELQDLHVPATFFMVGRRVDQAPEIARAVAAAGFTVGNHTWAHVDMVWQSGPEVRAALARTRNALARAGIPPTRLMRPPYGALDGTAVAAIRAEGLTPVLWTIDSLDWKYGDAAQIAQRVLAALRPGPDNLVLQHDGVTRSPISIKAVPMIVDRARERGYCFVGLDKHGRPSWPRGYRP